MTSPSSITKSLDLCLRIGDVLLSCGAGVADVTATIRAVAHHLGLRPVEVEVTFINIGMSFQPDSEAPPIVMLRQASRRTIDYEHLTGVDTLVRDLLLNKVSRDTAHRRIVDMANSPQTRRPTAIWAATALLGAGVAFQLGGNWLVAAAAASASGVVHIIAEWLSSRRVPSMYRQFAGGLLATLPAIGLKAAGVPISASLVITASIVLLLSGIGFVGAMQDALSEFYITASARTLEALLATTGLIAGVGAGLAVANRIGVPMGVVAAGYATNTSFFVTVAGAVVASGSFAFSTRAPLRSLAPTALLSGLAMTITLMSETVLHVGRIWAVAMAAFTIGVTSYSLAGKFRVPPLVLVTSAIVPLLPGLTILKALSQLGSETSVDAGLLSLATAFAIAIALASGVILGEMIAQPLKREGAKLERRLAGPRLVGPFSARNVRHRKR